MEKELALKNMPKLSEHKNRPGDYIQCEVRSVVEPSRKRQETESCVSPAQRQLEHLSNGEEAM